MTFAVNKTETLCTKDKSSCLAPIEAFKGVLHTVRSKHNK